MIKVYELIMHMKTHNKWIRNRLFEAESETSENTLKSESQSEEPSKSSSLLESDDLCIICFIDEISISFSVSIFKNFDILIMCHLAHSGLYELKSQCL